MYLTKTPVYFKSGASVFALPGDDPSRAVIDCTIRQEAGVNG